MTYGCFLLQFKLNIMLRDKCVRTFSVMWKKKLCIDILLAENKKKMTAEGQTKRCSRSSNFLVKCTNEKVLFTQQ